MPSTSPRRNHPEAEKKLYEDIGAIAGTIGDDWTANLLTSLLGLHWDSSRGYWVRDPDDQATAEKTARRWLADTGNWKAE